MSWNFNLFFHSLWLNFKPQAVCLNVNTTAWFKWAEMLISFFILLIELQTSSCFLKVMLPRAWNASPRLGSNELKWLFLFSFFVIVIQTSSCLIKCESKAWLKWAKMLISSFILCDWIRNLNLFFEGLVAESLKSEPKAWTKWFEMLIYFFILFDWTPNLKLFFEGLVAESLKCEPKAWLSWVQILIYFFILCDWTSNLKLFVQIWAQGLAQMSWNGEL
jgi:hypothetical protein